jgi:hypothetical protein
MTRRAGIGRSRFAWLTGWRADGRIAPYQAAIFDRDYFGTVLRIRRYSSQFEIQFHFYEKSDAVSIADIRCLQLLCGNEALFRLQARLAKRILVQSGTPCTERDRQRAP